MDLAGGADRLDVPRIAVDYHGKLFAALDASEVDVEPFRPEIFPIPRIGEVCHQIVNEVPNAQQAYQVVSAFEGGADYVIEVRDTFDNSDYYVPVPPDQNPEKFAKKYAQGGIIRVMGILSREKATQIWPQLRHQMPTDAVKRLVNSQQDRSEKTGFWKRLLTRLFGAT